MTLNISVEETTLYGTARTESVASCPSKLPAAPLPYLYTRFSPDAEVVTHLGKTAVEIRGIVARLFPDDALPADVLDTTRSLVNVLYSAKRREWPKYPTPPIRIHPTCQARETARLLNAIGYRSSFRSARFLECV